MMWTASCVKDEGWVGEKESPSHPFRPTQRLRHHGPPPPLRAGFRLLTLINIARRRLVLPPQRRIAHLHRQTVLEIQQTRLARPLDLCAGRADLRLLEPPAVSWVPLEDGEGAVADLAFLAELLAGLVLAPSRRGGGDAGCQASFECGLREEKDDRGQDDARSDAART